MSMLLWIFERRNGFQGLPALCCVWEIAIETVARHNFSHALSSLWMSTPMSALIQFNCLEILFSRVSTLRVIGQEFDPLLCHTKDDIEKVPVASFVGPEKSKTPIVIDFMKSEVSRAMFYSINEKITVYLCADNIYILFRISSDFIGFDKLHLCWKWSHGNCWQNNKVYMIE